MDMNMLDELKERLPLVGMGKPALVGVAAVVVVVAAVAASTLAGALSPAAFEVSRASASATEEASGSSVAQPASLFVHVSGAVRNPGLCELQAGARVADAVNAAGGFADDAEPASVNLARALQDGEQVVVSAKGETAYSSVGEPGQTIAPSAAASASGLVNINTASAAELIELPGVGEATAAKIIADRQANGMFETIEDLKRVSGIGDKKFEALSGLICV